MVHENVEDQTWLVEEEGEETVALPMEKMMVPKDLQCPFCSKLLEAAILVPCCLTAACDECARNSLIESNHSCQICQEKDVSPEDLMPNLHLRKKVLGIRNKAAGRDDSAVIMQQRRREMEEEKEAEETRLVEAFFTSNINTLDNEDSPEARQGQDRSSSGQEEVFVMTPHLQTPSSSLFEEPSSPAQAKRSTPRFQSAQNPDPFNESIASPVPTDTSNQSIGESMSAPVPAGEGDMFAEGQYIGSVSSANRTEIEGVSGMGLKDYCARMYDEAGSLVNEQEEQITLLQYRHILSDKVSVVLAEVLFENPLPFKLQPFQMLALHALGSGSNVLLLCPTGSGKMIVVFLAILVLQKIHSVPGVGVGSQPLNSIMQEKLKQPYIPTGIISMKGDLQPSSSIGSEKEDVILTNSLEDFKSGKIKCILGHAESWLSSVGEEILESLQEDGKILLTFLDEAHIPLSGHWDNFRHQLKMVPGLLRGRARKGAPCLAMTATLTPQEVTELESTLGLRSNTLVLKANCIQDHHKYIRYSYSTYN